jgi:hypothetical protein
MTLLIHSLKLQLCVATAVVTIFYHSVPLPKPSFTRTSLEGLLICISTLQ